MSLKQELAQVFGTMRLFIIYRVAGSTIDDACTALEVTRSAYNSWTMKPEFKSVYQKLDNLQIDYREEAIGMLRRDNQLLAVTLEKEIMNKMIAEVTSGNITEHSMIRTHLGRDVYSKLVENLNLPAIPKDVKSLTWVDARRQILESAQPQIGQGLAQTVVEGECIDANAQSNNTSPESSKTEECEQSRDDKVSE
jgi:hypothetical protein